MDGAGRLFGHQAPPDGLTSHGCRLSRAGPFQQLNHVLSKGALPIVVAASPLVKRRVQKIKIRKLALADFALSDMKSERQIDYWLTTRALALQVQNRSRSRLVGIYVVYSYCLWVTN